MEDIDMLIQNGMAKLPLHAEQSKDAMILKHLSIDG